MIKFKNGIYIPSDDIHAGTFVRLNSSRMICDTEFDFDFRTTVSDILQMSLGHNFYRNWDYDSWEHLRNDLHWVLRGEYTSVSIADSKLRYDVVGVFNTKSKGQELFSYKGSKNRITFRPRRILDACGYDRNDENVICNLICPRYLTVIDTINNKREVLTYVPYLKSINTFKGEL